MAETLGDAVLILRTDDRGLNAGVDQAEAKSRGLGRTLDATSGSASKLGKAIADAGKSAGTAGGQTQQYTTDIARLKAQVDPAWASLMKFKDGAALARQALQEGAISGKQYVEYMRASANAAGLLTNAQGKLTQMTGAQRVGMQQLGMQFNDMATMYALGARPAQIFASQIGQITQAIQLMSGGTSRVAAFLGGPWGIALSTAVVVLTPFIAKLFESEDAANKSSKANETWAEKLSLSKHSLDEVTEALREYNAEKKKANEITLQSASDEARSTYQTWQTVLALRQKLAAQLAADEASAAGNAGQGTGGLAGARAQGELDRTRARIAENNKALAEAEQAYRNASNSVADVLAKFDTDPTTRIKAGFDGLRQRARSTITDVDQLRRRLAELNRAEEAELKKVRDSGRAGSGNSNRQYGREISIADAQRIAQGAGWRVTSGERSFEKQKALYDDWVAKGRPADNPVARPGSSAHERGNGLDIAFGAGVSPASIRKAFEDEGVRLTKILKERGHYHVEWSRAGADRADNAAQRQKEQEERRQESYSGDLGGLMQEAANIRRQMATTVEERYQLELEALNIAIEEQKRRINANSDYGDAEKAKLLAQLDIKAGLERELLDRRRQEEAARQALEVSQALQANESELLQKQLNLTGLREKRLEIEQQLLDRAYAQRRQALEAIRPNDSRYAAAQVDLAKLPDQQAADQRILDRQYESPAQRYIREVRGVDTSINDQMENVAVDGLRTLEDRLVAVGMRTRDLGKAFKDVANQIIADLLRIGIQRAIIAPLANALFGPEGNTGAGAGAAAGGGGLKGFIGNLLGSVVQGFAASAGGGGGGASFSGYHAMGGLIPTGTFGIVGEKGPEPIMATAQGAMVHPNSSLSQFGSRSGPETLEVNVSGARGNREIMDMVQAGVRAGLSQYDGVVTGRVQDGQARFGQ